MEKDGMTWEVLRLEEARLSVNQTGGLMWWRPNQGLPEERQYCLVRRVA